VVHYGEWHYSEHYNEWRIERMKGACAVIIRVVGCRAVRAYDNERRDSPKRHMLFGQSSAFCHIETQANQTLLRDPIRSIPNSL